MNTNHTPESFSIQNGSNHLYICSDQRGYLAKSIGDSEDALAVTRSIVETLNNAPALLAALEGLLNLHDEQVFICGEDDETQVESVLHTARTVIAQAKGETK